MACKNLLLAACLCLAASVFSADLKTKSGKVYKNYKIEQITPNGVIIDHSAGNTAIALTDMPDDLSADVKQKISKALGERASFAEARNQQKNDDKILKRYEQITNGNIKVIQVIPNGLLVQLPNGGGLIREGKIKGECQEEVILIMDYPDRGIVDNDPLPPNYFGRAPHVPEKYSDAYVNCLFCFKPKEFESADEADDFIKKESTLHSCRGENGFFRCCQMGIYTYNTNAGLRTVRKFTVDRNKALEFAKSQQSAKQ